jgi:hypothetical protein
MFRIMNPFTGAFAMLTTKSTSMQSGYYREDDTWLYLTFTGELFVVADCTSPAPLWESVELPMPDDATLRIPSAEDLAAFERSRIAYGIPE